MNQDSSPLPPDDLRGPLIEHWLNQTLDSAWRLEKVADDASFRRYFRVFPGRKQTAGSLILMDAPPGLEPLEPFVDITRRLRDAGLHAPQIMARNTADGLLLLEDLGDTLFRQLITPDGGAEWLALAFDALEIMVRRVDVAGLPDYDARRLGQELELFPDWYLDQHLRRPWSSGDRQRWSTLCELLIDSALAQPQGFVHRDFHSCNLLATSADPPGIIDYQDAVRGPVSYDLVSLLWDRYVEWPRTQIDAWLDQLRPRLLADQATDMTAAHWRRSCYRMGLQRNLKIIGIFARLNHRDSKPAYLRLIPRFRGYVLQALQWDPALHPYRTLLEPVLCEQ